MFQSRQLPAGATGGLARRQGQHDVLLCSIPHHPPGCPKHLSWLLYLGSSILAPSILAQADTSCRYPAPHLDHSSRSVPHALTHADSPSTHTHAAASPDSGWSHAGPASWPSLAALNCAPRLCPLTGGVHHSTKPPHVPVQVSVTHLLLQEAFGNSCETSEHATLLSKAGPNTGKSRTVSACQNSFLWHLLMCCTLLKGPCCV